jgi:hypothetical protein
MWLFLSNYINIFPIFPDQIFWKHRRQGRYANDFSCYCSLNYSNLIDCHILEHQQTLPVSTFIISNHQNVDWHIQPCLPPLSLPPATEPTHLPTTTATNILPLSQDTINTLFNCLVSTLPLWSCTDVGHVRRLIQYTVHVSPSSIPLEEIGSMYPS